MRISGEYGIYLDIFLKLPKLLGCFFFGQASHNYKHGNGDELSKYI